MNRLTSLVLLLVFLTCTDSASAQLLRRVRRVLRPANCCCCAAEQAASATDATSHAARADAAPPEAAAETTDYTDVTEPAAAGSPSSDAASEDSESVASPSDTTDKSPDDTKAWKRLFDGKTLGDWVSSRFGGEGEVVVENGQITCDYGQYITGITYQGKDLPKNNYEIELEAMRVEGSDFFCGLTFPVDDKHATFVVGGWGGSVTGISSIDSYDASENDTTDYMEFKNKQWYKIRVRVTPGVLEAWIDKKKMVSEEVESSRLSTRIEVDPSKPLGVCCFDTQAAFRNIQIRTETKPDMELAK